LLKVDKSLLNDVCLISTVGALGSCALHECVVPTNVVATNLPIVGVFRNFTKGKGDREAATQLELLELDTSSPIIKAR